MICYSCKNECDSNELSEYELKSGGNVDICFVCENTHEYYLDVIKRECLIDGISHELSSSDTKQIGIEKKQRLERELEQRQLAEALDTPKSILYFSNEPRKKPDYNYQVLRYVNEFLGMEDEHEESHIQRFKFKEVVGKHWHLDEWDGLTNVNVYIDSFSKEYQRLRNPNETNWRDRTRKWYSGRFECNEDFYNVTFGFSQYDDEPFGKVYVNYRFICSKSGSVKKLVEELRDEKLLVS